MTTNTSRHNRSPHLAGLIRTVLTGLTLVFSLAVLPVLAQNASPTAAVESVVNAILEILRKPDFVLEKDRAAIKAEILQGFDSVAMAQSVLSTNWRQTTPAQQEEFKGLLMQTIENTYIGRIQAYSNETVNFKNEEISNNRASVTTTVISAGKEIPVVYKLRLRSDGWFVYDVEIENVSMVNSYRDTYRSIVNSSGMDGLLEQMLSKLAELGV